MALVRGVGVYEKGEFPVRVEGRYTKEYCLWQNMLRRCYDKNFKDSQLTYSDCSVSENFKNFQYFAKWCGTQVGFYTKDFQLDKDILIKDNKIYSEDICVFVPRNINILLTDRAAARGEYPIGLYYCERFNKFIAQMSQYGRNKKLGSYDTQAEAQLSYKVAKEKYVKEVANQFKDLIDIRVYNSLIKWEVIYE